MTYKYNSVYIANTATVAGPYEIEGPLSKYFDIKHDKDMYIGEKSLELAEVKLLKESINHLLKKTDMKPSDINLFISGDLQNQISASNYAARDYDFPFMGVFNACATSGEALIIGASLIDGNKINNSICSVCSHNMVAEKQFRNPTEYGALKPKTSTFTVTGAASVLLTNKRNKIRIESSTIGKAIDYGMCDVNHMGAIMAPAAADTIKRHLIDLKREASYYDLILTGDLGVYGKDILIELMKTNYNIDIKPNYEDAGVMIYDRKNQPVFAGGSGPVCSGLVNFGYIYKEMLDKKFKKVLFVPTGAIFSPTFVFQKQTVPSIAHAISLEVV